MCGIVGIVDAGGVSHSLYYALFALQHRGQESAGISTWDGSSFYKYKGMGLVSEVFSEQNLRDLKGHVGVGHVRYPTTGANLPENTQPFNFRFQDHHFAIAYNGNLVNAAGAPHRIRASGRDLLHHHRYRGRCLHHRRRVPADRERLRRPSSTACTCSGDRTP